MKECRKKCDSFYREGFLKREAYLKVLESENEQLKKSQEEAIKYIKETKNKYKLANEDYWHLDMLDKLKSILEIKR